MASLRPTAPTGNFSLASDEGAPPTTMPVGIAQRHGRKLEPRLVAANFGYFSHLSPPSIIAVDLDLLLELDPMHLSHCFGLKQLRLL
ncbi:hypothetical protein PanWU01x14_112780 [Parasponia andersonii]|uniref:Uncharacterized protein n=1 Tax=Parasponia andersonii TaxID=3476 RepID=A0A2P5CYE0_PARAD|nr:hypothetical protein PanWU01x14_112780 [Parasponia andersonii]